MLHYSDPGLAFHVAPLYPGYPKEQQNLIISQPVAISMMVLLVLLSEISIFFEYDDRQKLRELWTYLAETIPLHKELYQIKYNKLL